MLKGLEAARQRRPLYRYGYGSVTQMQNVQTISLRSEALYYSPHTDRSWFCVSAGGIERSFAAGGAWASFVTDRLGISCQDWRGLDFPKTKSFAEPRAARENSNSGTLPHRKSV